MKVQIQARDRQALLILGIALIGYLVTTEIALPVYDGWSAMAASVPDKEDQLQRFRSALANSGNEIQQEARIRALVEDAESRLISGQNTSLAAADMQSLVERIAAEAAITLNQRNMTPPRDQGEFFTEIGMAVGFEASPRQLLTFLSGLQGVTAPLVVRSAYIAPLQSVAEMPASGELRKTLSVNLTLTTILSNPIETR